MNDSLASRRVSTTHGSSLDQRVPSIALRARRLLLTLVATIALATTGFCNWPPVGTSWPPIGGGGPFTSLPGFTCSNANASGNPVPLDWSTSQRFKDALASVALLDPSMGTEILGGLLNGAVNFYSMDPNSRATGITSPNGDVVTLDLSRPLEEVIVTLVHEWAHVRATAGAMVGPDGTLVATVPLPQAGANLPCHEAHAYAAGLQIMKLMQQNHGTSPLFKCSFIKDRQEKCEKKNSECDWTAPPPGAPQPSCEDLVSELSDKCL